MVPPGQEIEQLEHPISQLSTRHLRTPITSTSLESWLRLVGPLAAIALGLVLSRSPRLAIGGAAAIALYVLPLWLLPLGAIATQHFAPNPGLLTGVAGGDAILPSDLLLGLFLARWMFGRLSKPASRALIADRESRWVLLFVAWAWISVVVNGSTASVTSLSRITLYLFCFIAAMSSPRIARPLFLGVAFLAVTQTVLAMLGITPREGLRILGAYGDPAATGALVLAGSAGSSLITASRRLLIIPVLLLGWVLSLTRVIWAAGAIEFLLLVFPKIHKRKFRLALLTVVCLGATYLIVMELTLRLSLNQESLPLRVESWRNGLDLIVQSPLFGHGWGLSSTAVVQMGDQAPLNLWINVAAATGIIGTLLLGGFMLSTFRTLTRSYGSVARATRAYLVAIAVLSLGEMTLQATGTTTVEWTLLLGAGLAHAKWSETHTGPRVTANAESEV